MSVSVSLSEARPRLRNGSRVATFSARRLMMGVFLGSLVSGIAPCGYRLCKANSGGALTSYVFLSHSHLFGQNTGVRGC